MYFIDRKKWVIGGSISLIILVLFGVYFSVDSYISVLDIKGDLVFYSYTKEVKKEVYLNEDSGLAHLYENGKEVERLNNAPYKDKGVLELPSTKNVYEITDEDKEVSVDTYEFDIETSVGVVNWLKEEGYEVERELGTSQFVEFYLSKGESIKRVIIFKKLLICSDVDDLSMTDDSEYINNYR